MITAIESSPVRNMTEANAEISAVFREYHLRLFHYALQLVGDREDAMDITQETFLRLQRHWARRDETKPIAAWLYAIARNLAIDQLRKRGTRNETEENPNLEDRHTQNPEHLASNSELRERLWVAIGQLPDSLREVILLRDWHGMRYAEIAEVTGTNATTVTSRLYEARQRLRNELRGYL
ncbi:MAG: sigma-70 family RNA polymerase sigma factor [Bryobacterales bacterium]|nr:sigma-70 family RNA polymerase sigma factor [Bryobacterales bacterium]